MVYRIKFISDEVEGFVREIEIDSDATFLDLNGAVLQACGYPDDQMTSFFLCDERWTRGPQVTREDMGLDAADEDIYVMADTRLSELIEEEEQKLEFVFDTFNDRVFYLDVKEFIPGRTLAQAKVVRAEGAPPVQIAQMDADAPAAGGKKGAADDFDSDAFYGSSDFNADDFDPEGFEISEGSPYDD